MALILSFQGLDAEQGRIEAFSGIESAAGLARSLTLIAHYVATGKVRHRFPFDETYRIYLESTEEGSFNWRLVLLCAGSLATGLGTNAIYDVTKLVFLKAIGQEPTELSAPVRDLNENRGGDIDALVEAVEPSLKKGHYGIGNTTSTITIYETTTTTKRTLAVFDSQSKSYLSDSVDAETDGQDVAISSLNANDSTGRAYFLDLKRTIPFRISRDADPTTLITVSKALDRYVNSNPAPIRITFRRIEAIDGRLKRIIIFSAEDVSEAL